MTSEYPYPGSDPGSDDAPYGNQPPAEPQPFSAFGPPAASNPPPAPAARAAVRVPGLVVSGPDDVPPPPPAQSGRGQVYGRSAPTTYGSAQQPPQQPLPQAPPPGVYGTPRVYGTPPPEAAPPPPRAAGIPVQRTSTVYGQRAPQPFEDDWNEAREPARAYEEDVYGRGRVAPGGWEAMAPAQSAPPRPAAPPWEPGPAWEPERPGPAWEPEAAPPANPQFEQHGRQTQSPAYAEPPSRSPRATWQEQLAPMGSPEPAPAPMPPPREHPAPAPADVAVPAPPKSKLRIVGYIAIAVAFVAAGAGALWYTGKTDPPKENTCVVQSGSTYQPASCGSSAAYRVGHTVSKVSDCPDYLNEPSITYDSGKKVICLQPAGGA